MGGHSEVVEVLLHANLDVSCSDERTIFGPASAINLIKILIPKSANPDLRNDSGETSLHEAVKAGWVSWLKPLLDLDLFDLNARTPRGGNCPSGRATAGRPQCRLRPSTFEGC